MYDPAETAVLSKFKVIVSVAEATELSAVPPNINNVSPLDIVCAGPLSPSALKE